MLGIILVVRLWFEWFQSVLTVLSLVAAALTIVSKELILNFMAYGIIIWRGLFNVGDRIQIGQHAGDVTEIGPSYFSIAEIGNWISSDEPTGRLLKMPNSRILTEPVANYTRGLSLIWNEVAVELSFNSNLRKAHELLSGIARTHTHQFSEEEADTVRSSSEEIMFTSTEPDVFSRIQDGKLTLSVRYLCKFHKRRMTEQAIWDDILQQFTSENDVTLLAKNTS